MIKECKESLALELSGLGPDMNVYMGYQNKFPILPCVIVCNPRDSNYIENANQLRTKIVNLDVVLMVEQSELGDEVTERNLDEWLDKLIVLPEYGEPDSVSDWVISAVVGAPEAVNIAGEPPALGVLIHMSTFVNV